MPKSFQWGEKPNPQDAAVIGAAIDAFLQDSRLRADATVAVFRSLAEVFAVGNEVGDSRHATDPASPPSEAAITAARRIAVAAVTTSTTSTTTWLGPLTLCVAENGKARSKPKPSDPG